MLSTLSIYLNIDILLFLYEPLCMSLYDAVADYSWSGYIKRTPRLLNYLRTYNWLKQMEHIYG